jgi:glutathione S-transferase
MEIFMREPWTAATTLLALLVYFLIIGMVATARAKYGVKAPAVTGNEQFERAYRVQMNTLEQMALFLPALWLYALYVSDVGAAVGGLLWIVGRLIYARAYLADPASRGPGAIISLVASVGLWIGAGYGVIKALI